LHDASRIGQHLHKTHQASTSEWSESMPEAHNGLVFIYHSHKAAQQQHVNSNVIPNARPLHLHCYRLPCGSQNALVHLPSKAGRP